MRKLCGLVAGMTACLISQAWGTTVSVRSTDALWNYATVFGAETAGPSSTTPVLTPIAAGPGQVLTFSSVTGAVSLTPGYTYGPDGGVSCPPGACPLSVQAAAGLSGIISGHSAFLAGVFLTGTETAATVAPPTLSFSTFSFSALSPLADQVFFIGDGLTGTGSGAVQTFAVPVGATELVLGIADANGYSGPPGAYFDNSGSFAATFAISAPATTPTGVPEPSAWALLMAGLLTFGVRRAWTGPT